MLWIWLPLSLAAFSLLRPRLAAVLSVMGGVMFLPSGLSIDVPPLPPLDREAVIGLGALLGAFLFSRRAFLQRIPGTGIDALILVFVLSGLATAAANMDPLVLGEGDIVRPGLQMYDGLALATGHALRVAAPYILGRLLFQSPQDLTFLLKSAAIGALLYSPLVAFELRFSPQLHSIVYGFFPHVFAQTARDMGWGWRPMVFMPHGLMLALFLASASIASTGLWSSRIKSVGAFPSHIVAVFLLLLLLLANSLGAALYGLLSLPLLLFAGPRTIVRVAALLALTVFAYPSLRSLDLFPTQSLVDTARLVSDDRAESLDFRFENENLLIARAAERPLFGWGGFGRNHVFDPVVGRAVTTTDGLWIILYGASGALGFASLFGAWLLPVFRISRHIQKITNRQGRMVAATTALIVAITAIDLLPNAFMNSFTLMTAGALAGVAETLRRPRRRLGSRFRRLRRIRTERGK